MYSLPDVSPKRAPLPWLTKKRTSFGSALPPKAPPGSSRSASRNCAASTSERRPCRPSLLAEATRSVFIGISLSVMALFIVDDVADGVPGSLDQLCRHASRLHTLAREDEIDNLAIPFNGHSHQFWSLLV